MGKTRVHYVAPLAGAWIETLACLMYPSRLYVAPLAGAWIETLASDAFLDARVAPLAGAWIETKAVDVDAGIIPSPPSRGRGLKPIRAG